MFSAASASPDYWRLLWPSLGRAGQAAGGATEMGIPGSASPRAGAGVRDR